MHLSGNPERRTGPDRRGVSVGLSGWRGPMDDLGEMPGVIEEHTARLQELSSLWALGKDSLHSFPVQAEKCGAVGTVLGLESFGGTEVAEAAFHCERECKRLFILHLPPYSHYLQILSLFCGVIQIRSSKTWVFHHNHSNTKTPPDATQHLCPLLQVNFLLGTVLPCSLLWKTDWGEFHSHLQRDGALSLHSGCFSKEMQPSEASHVLENAYWGLWKECVIWVAIRWDTLSFYCLDQEKILEASLRKEPALCIVQRRDGKLWRQLDFQIAKASFSLFGNPFELRFCYLKLKIFKWMQKKIGGPKHVPTIYNGSFKPVDALLTTWCWLSFCSQ